MTLDEVDPESNDMSYRERKGHLPQIWGDAV